MSRRMAGAVLGIDVGGTKMLAVGLDGSGEILVERREQTPRDSDAIVEGLCELIEGLRSEVGDSRNADVDAVGIGVPGLVDRSGTLRFAPNLVGVTELPVAQLVADRTGLPVQVDNDATCAAWAEHRHGAAAGVDDVVLVTLGTGIGGGIVADGRVLLGANGFAGEIGHMVIERNGVPCPCGRRGCWERYASGSGLGRMGREAIAAGRGTRILECAGGDADAVQGEHVTRAAIEGDPDALELLEEMAGWLALGLVNVVNAFDCQLLVIGGGLVEIGELLLEPTRRAFREGVVAPSHRPDVPIVAAQLADRAGAVGAALLARDAFGRSA